MIQNIKMSLTLDEALEVIDKINYKTEKETIHINNALNRVLAEDISSAENVPPFRRSSLDGYAIKSQDTIGVTEENPIKLDIIEEVPAGNVPLLSVKSGQCTKILTGAPVPDGADAVIRYEDVTFDSQNISLGINVNENANVAPIGEVIKKGELLSQEGDIITPSVGAVLSSVGVSKVSVYKKAKVALISTGSEVVSVDDELPKGKIRNSSHFMIKGYVENINAEVNYLGICKDDTDSISKKISEGLKDNDIVITTGGVSVGDYDLVKDAVLALGGEIVFWKLKLKPGSAFLLAKVNGKYVVGLSGNPGSAYITFQLIAIPLIKKIMGMSDYRLEKITVKLMEPLCKKRSITQYIRGKLIIKDATAYIKLLPKQRNGMLNSELMCDILAELLPNTNKLDANSLINAFLIG